MTQTKPRHTLSNKNPDTMTADCAVCGPGISLARVNKGNGEYRLTCRTKRNQTINAVPSRKRTVARYNANRRRSSHHGMTAPEREAFLAGKVCAGCGTSENLRVDHCHCCAMVRDPLCNSCNLAYGMVSENASTLRNLAALADAHGCG